MKGQKEDQLGGRIADDYIKLCPKGAELSNR